MSKTLFKKRISQTQNGECALTGAELPQLTALFDTDRIDPKRNGGIYTLSNTRDVLPRAHMQRHGTLRMRDEALDGLKSVFDDRVQTIKLRNKINNQLLAYQRQTDHQNDSTAIFLKEQLKPVDTRLKAIDRDLAKLIKNYPSRLVQAAMKVPSLGPITIAALTFYIDLEKASTPSALWKYTGLHVAAGERYKKGEAGGGNKTLRTILWNTAVSMMKNKKCPYRLIYDRTKLRLSRSSKIVKSRNTKGLQVEVAWKEAKPCHRHGAALRAIMKRVLQDYWLTGRKLAGLPVTSPYVEGVLGHRDIEKPEDFGWPK
jgi:hypothetical protein